MKHVVSNENGSFAIRRSLSEAGSGISEWAFGNAIMAYALFLPLELSKLIVWCVWRDLKLVT